MKHLNISMGSRVREVFLNGTFVANTNFKDQITSLSWHDAIVKVQDLNTIAALTFHINYYLDGLLYAFDTGKLEIHDKFSFDMPLIKSENDWTDLINRFLKNAELFALHVESLNHETFERDFIDAKYGSFARNIEAVIEHSYYHLGQIVLIKKMINAV